jgi:segregation and condensation protein B
VLDPVKAVEALLFAADEPLGVLRIAETAGVEPQTIPAAVETLNREYAETGRTFRIHRVAQGFQLYTLADYADLVRRLYQSQHVQRLSRAALEVLAIVAYNQPITRPEIEKLRGVDCSGPLLTLLERRLIATAGRARRAGNPFLYRTTREFLRYFGLEKLEDLPRMEELGEFLAGREAGVTAEVRQFESLAVDYGSAKTPEV